MSAVHLPQDSVLPLLVTLGLGPEVHIWEHASKAPASTSVSARPFTLATGHQPAQQHPDATAFRSATNMRVRSGEELDRWPRSSTPTRQTTSCRKHEGSGSWVHPPTARWQRNHGLHARPDRVGACLQGEKLGRLTRRCRTSRSSSLPSRQARWSGRCAAPNNDPCALAKYET